MKRLFSIFCLILSFFLLSSCELNLNLNNDSNSNTSNKNELDKEKVLDILDVYRNKKYYKVIENVDGELNEGVNISYANYIKNTYVDYDDDYFYSIYNDNKIFVDKEKVYLENSKKTMPIYNQSELVNPFDFIGISELFSLTDFVIKENKAIFTISGDQILKFNRLLENTRLELSGDVDSSQIFYNPSVLIVDVYIEDNDIDYISFDLSLAFGSFFESLVKTISFEFDEFEKLDLKAKIENESFTVETGENLNAYILEMVYEFGDSIYIKSGDFDMLIDAGQYPDGENVKKMLDEHCTDDTLDVLIATHGHADHTGGFSNGALDTIEKVNLIIDYGYKDDNSYAYERLRDDYISNGAFYASAYDCVNMLGDASKIYKFSDDLSLEVLNTNQYLKTGSYMPNDGNENDYSVVCKLTFKNNTYLFTGDLSGDKFTSALKEENLSNITVYKAAHHGATTYNSNNQTFLNYLNPQICVSSAAIINQDKPTDHSAYGEIVYQHPRPLFVRWILNTPTIKNTKAYYFNGTMGTIKIVDNGVDLPIVNGLGATRGYNDASGNKITNEENKKFYDTYMYQNYYK